MVEGRSHGRRRKNVPDHRIQISQDPHRRNPPRRNPPPHQPIIAPRIPLGLIPPRMRLAINLNRQPRIAAEKVADLSPVAC